MSVALLACAGTMRPDCSVNSIVGSATSGALTNETNRDILFGSSSTPFHSHAYPSTWRARPPPSPRVPPGMAGPRPLELGGQPERVVAHDVTQVVQPALERLEPRRGA